MWSGLERYASRLSLSAAKEGLFPTPKIIEGRARGSKDAGKHMIKYRRIVRDGADGGRIGICYNGKRGFSRSARHLDEAKSMQSPNLYAGKSRKRGLRGRWEGTNYPLLHPVLPMSCSVHPQNPGPGRSGTHGSLEVIGRGGGEAALSSRAN